MTRITHSLRTPDGSPVFSNADYEESHQRNESMFRRGQAEGILGSFDPRVMAVTRQGAIDMMLLYFDSHPGTDIEKYADELADFLLAATRHSGD